ncbi:ribonucleoside-diphosphate reductase, alpha subunit [Hydrogenobaculum sp. Y04AAS1]|uniref:ribonucleoside-diphosphate reductase subunit alpha n=1 Tax=Hydrogenobaculum sp. (strain Y04AAS1) TaxID=380749 RepID=UPI00015BC77F|nr:ribonucleoside-diphosphate reductase, alpha subunit [Hydrogenobaculum sp. Y04AAS1]HCT66010.1 ribonucleoside-diphosphate reductase subunit alpha [Hydrogenobaculum sp.]
MEVIKRSGAREKLDLLKIRTVLENALSLLKEWKTTKDISAQDIEEWTMEDLNEINIDEIMEDIEINIFDGIETAAIFQHILHSLLTRAIDDPIYDAMARNVLLQRIYKQAFGGMYSPKKAYKELFIDYIDNAVELGLLDEKLASYYDLEMLALELVPKRDQLLKFNGLYNLMDRYLIKDLDTGNILEAPQWFWMRVAMGVALVEKTPEDRNHWAIEFYHMMSSMEFIPSTPTLFNSGTRFPQLSSCFVVDEEDDLSKIFETVKQVGMLNKHAGGVGLPATKLRAKDSIIRSIQGKSSGIIPFLKIIDETITAVSQGGRRRGSALASLEPWHLDVFDFVRTKRKWGDDSQRFKNLKIALFLNDEFMRRVEENGDWYLFDPADCPKLVSTYGKKFSREYSKCIRKALSGKIRHKKIKAVELFKEAIENTIQTGEPWYTFKDPINIRHPNKHTGTILTTNLCTEQLLVSTYDSIESCNLGSLVLPRALLTHFRVNEHAQPLNSSENGSKHTKFLSNNTFDWEKFKAVIRKAIRFLDNVIDANYYALEAVEKGTKQSRKIGLGFMGYQDMIEKLKLPVDSKEALKLLDKIGETMSYVAIETSVELAKERGTYPNFDGSDWSKGILPIDTLEHLFRERSLTNDKYTTPYNDMVQNYADENRAVQSRFDDREHAQPLNSSENGARHTIDYKKLVDKYVGLQVYHDSDDIAEDESRAISSHFDAKEQDKSTTVSQTLQSSENGLEHTLPAFNWEELREKVKQGIRNACQTTLAPTATISIIAGTSQSFEPYYALVYSRTNIAGRFLEVNENFIRDLKKLGLWDRLREDVLLQQGSIQDIKEIPQEIKDIYKTAYEIDTEVYIKQAAVLQKWIDSSISRNLYFNTRDPQKIMEIYLKAWKYGLKATYYAFMPAKIKTEGKYVHEDIKEPQSSQDKEEDKARALSAHFNSEEQTKAPKNSETRHAVESTQAKTVSSASSSKPKNGNKGKLVESDNLMPLDEIMKEKGYCEECGN